MHLRQSRKNPVYWFGFAIIAWLLLPAGLIAQTPAADTETNAAKKPIFEEWVLLTLEDKPCGFGNTITTESDASGSKVYTTKHVEKFVVKRLDTDMTITQTSEVTEDTDGGVISFTQSTTGLGMDIVSNGKRDSDDLLVTSRGQNERYHLPRLAALGPDKIRRMSYDVPLKPGQAFSFNTFVTDYPQSVVVEKGTVQVQETRDVRGTKRKLWKLVSEMSAMPGILSTSWVDDKGQDVEALTVIPGIGDLHEYVTTRAECMVQPEGAEIFAPTLIHPDRAIPSPASLASATYRITLNDPCKQITLWNQGEQKLLSSKPGSCEIEVSEHPVDPDSITWQLPRADTPDLHPYLQATSYLEVNTPEIQDLAKKAVGDEKNPVKAAKAIQEFVRAYITKKDLNIGFASAQETAKSREGDCTEHAVLCAAIGRAAGLPTRCVFGFGYIPPGIEEPAISAAVDTDTGIFGFHMWAEAWVGPDQWVPMDAALKGFDVAHIAIAKTALQEINPLIDLSSPILQLMENIKIEVVKTVPKTAHSPAPKTAPVTVPATSPTQPSPSPASPAPSEPSAPTPFVPAPPPPPEQPPKPPEVD